MTKSEPGRIQSAMPAAADPAALAKLQAHAAQVRAAWAVEGAKVDREEALRLVETLLSTLRLSQSLIGSAGQAQALHQAQEEIRKAAGDSVALVDRIMAVMAENARLLAGIREARLATREMRLKYLAAIGFKKAGPGEGPDPHTGV